jgi:hypothetical protein
MCYNARAMKKYLLFILFSILLNFSVYSEVFAISGFVPKQIWYSAETLVEGDTVEVHTAVWNGESKTFLVKVEFYDNKTILGDREVTIVPSELKDVYVLWKVTAGEHTILAKIISSEVVVSGVKESVTLRYTQTASDKQSISEREIEKESVTTEENVTILKNILPENVDETISKSYSTIDNFRNETAVKLEKNKEEAKKEVAQIEEENDKADSSEVSSEKNRTEDVIKKPLAYVKLFLNSVLAFIFGNKFVFYGLLIFIVFYFFKLIFKAIRNK